MSRNAINVVMGVFVTAVFGLAGCGVELGEEGGSSVSASGGGTVTKGTLKIINSTGQAIDHAYLSTASSTAWGADQISSSITNGSTRDIVNTPAGSYDVKVALADGSIIYEYGESVLAGVTTACAIDPIVPGSTPAPTPVGNAQQQAPFKTLQKGAVSPHDNKPIQVSIIRNEVEWANFWNLLYTNYLPKPALPSVDFNESVLVSVVDTTRPSGGYSITITNIQPTSSGITVNASQVPPGQSCSSTAALTQPFHVVTTPIFSGVATLELSQSVFNCSQ